MKKPYISIFILIILAHITYAGMKGYISGTIFDFETKKVLPDALVELETPEIKYVVKTNKAGKYFINNIVENVCLISINKPGYQVIKERKIIKNGHKDLSNYYLKPGSNIYITDICRKLRKKNSCTLIGVLKDSQNNESIQNAIILIENLNDSLKSDSMGRFYKNDIRSGELCIHIKAKTYEQLIFTTDIGDTLKVDIELKRDPEEKIKRDNIIYKTCAR